MTYQLSVATALLLSTLSASWAQEPPPTDEHKQHQAPTTADMDTMPGMDHSQMNHSAMPGMDHSQMNHSGTMPSNMVDGEAPTMQGGSAPANARDPNAYADGYSFGPLAHHTMGNEDSLSSLLVDRLESITAHGNTAMTYDWQAWYGKTFDRALIRAEGDIDGGTFTESRNELLWAHAISTYWDTQLGLRYDSGKGVDRGWLALGVQGTAFYWLYVEATGYVNEQGRTTFRLETEYDLLLTQKLILQPRIEMNAYSHSDPSRSISSGLSDFSGGLRLRYEIVREFAPYLGVEWAGQFGAAADNLRANGDYANGLLFVAGVRFWL